MNGSQTKQDETEVLVVGAGPVGLMAAGELARRGIAVRVVENAAGRSPLSKALVVQPRTLETIDLIGLADEFVRRGTAFVSESRRSVGSFPRTHGGEALSSARNRRARSSPRGRTPRYGAGAPTYRLAPRLPRGAPALAEAASEGFLR